MMILNFLLNFLVRSQERKPFLMSWVLGCAFLFLAVCFGIYFLFQALVPVLGYLESGALLSVLLAGIGLFLLYLSRRKRSHPLNDVMGGAQDIFEKIESEIKHLHLDKKIKEHGPAILLCSFIAGLALSQFKDGKKIALLKDKLLQLGGKKFLK